MKPLVNTVLRIKSRKGFLSPCGALAHTPIKVGTRMSLLQYLILCFICVNLWLNICFFCVLDEVKG